MLAAHNHFLKAQANGSLPPPEVLQPPVAPIAPAQVVETAASDTVAAAAAATAPAAAAANIASVASSGADVMRDAATSGEGQVPVSHGEHPEENDVAAAGPAAQTVQPVGCVPMPTISVVSCFLSSSFVTLASTRICPSCCTSMLIRLCRCLFACFYVCLFACL